VRGKRPAAGTAGGRAAAHCATLSPCPRSAYHVVEVLRHLDLVSPRSRPAPSVLLQMFAVDADESDDVVDDVTIAVAVEVNA